jgi:Na+/melibiose symporter-like transporter
MSPSGATPTAPAAAGEPLRAGSRAAHKRGLMVLLGALVGLEFLENGMFVFAASHVVGGIAAAPREFARVQAAYAVGSMMMIVLQQSLSRRFGYRRYLVAALGLFALGAAGSAAADGVMALTLARLVQGVGGGALFTGARVLVPLLFPAAERARALKYFMLILFGMSACAPALAAALTDGPGWRWIFIAVVPMAASALVAAWWLLPDAVGRGAAPVRWAAAPLLMAAAALILLQLALSVARFDVFAHPLQLAVASAGGAALLAAFLLHQWHHDEPLLRLRELRHPAFAMGLVLYFMHYLLSNATNYVFPIFAEQSLGFPLLVAGWLNTFSAGVALVGAWAWLKLGPRLPNKRPAMALGALMLVVAGWMFTKMPPGVQPSQLLPALFAKGLFGVMLVLPVAGLTFRDLGEDRFAHGYQSKNLMRQLAGSFSTAVAAVFLERREFAERSAIAGHLDVANPQGDAWFAQAQAGFAAQGLGPDQAHAAAVATLARTIDQQAALLACEDLYRVLCVLALVTAAFALLQRRLR